MNQFGQKAECFASSHVKITRYLCGRCGFSEERIDDREGIESIRKALEKH